MVKRILRKLFTPLLDIFERGDEPFTYKKSHRTVLLVLGSLFLFLSIIAMGLGVSFGQFAAVIPGIVFLAIAVTALVIGTMGSDRAVSKIWGNK